MKITHKNFKKARKLIATEHIKKVNQPVVYEYFSTSDLDKSKKHSLGLDLANIIIYQRAMHYIVPKLYDYMCDFDKVIPQTSSANYQTFLAKY